MKLRHKGEGGFSLLELVIVVVVILVVSAMAMPKIFQVIYNIRLRSATQTISGMLQTCRIQSVRDNTFYFLRTKAIGNKTWVWVSRSSTSTAPATGEPQAVLGASIVTSTSPPSQPSVGYTPLSFALNKIPAFNSRGLPCFSAGTRCQTQYTAGSGSLTVGFQMYLTDSRPVGANGWAAIMVSPAGRVQTFVYDGSNWQQ